MRLSDYRAYLFDCDGVILDSNRVKSDAFHAVARARRPDVADEFVAYHQANGGISRFVKIRYLYETWIPDGTEEDIREAIAEYARLVVEGLLTCDEAPGLREFLGALDRERPRIVVTGGAQDEVRQVFRERGLDELFDAIHGSPSTKPDIFSGLLSRGDVQQPAVYFGDSLGDYRAARGAGLDFVFLSALTESEGWQQVLEPAGVLAVPAWPDLAPGTDVPPVAS